MKTIRELFQKKSFQKGVLDEKTLFFIVKKIIEGEFGKVGSENVYPDKIINKTLILKTSGSLWSSEVWLRKDYLMKKINQEAGDNLIEKIRV